MAADREELRIGSYWEVVGGLSIDTNPDPQHIFNSQNRGSQRPPPSNYGQTVADGITFWIDRRCQVIAVANVPKYSMDSHYVCRQNRSSTSAAFVPQFVGVLVRKFTTMLSISGCFSGFVLANFWLWLHMPTAMSPSFNSIDARHLNKKLTSWLGRQNVAPLKFYTNP